MITTLLLLLGSLIWISYGRKVWNTRFAYRFSTDPVAVTVTELCIDVETLSAQQVLGSDADGLFLRDVMSAIVDKGDQQRFLEVLNLVAK